MRVDLWCFCMLAIDDQHICFGSEDLIAWLRMRILFCDEIGPHLIRQVKYSHASFQLFFGDLHQTKTEIVYPVAILLCCILQRT